MMTDASAARPEPHGIGGWLILPMLGTFISLTLSAYGVFQSIDVLTRYGHKQSAAWNYIVIGEAIFSFAMVVGWTVAVITLFQHKRIFPSLFVFLLAATFALSLADVIVVSQVLNQKIDSASIRDVTRPFLSLIIWGPYMYMSRRVKNTFIH
jgi:hypothetical protein